MRGRLIAAIPLGVVAAAFVSAQEPTLTNTIGMEFVLIKPGRFVVGRFEPPYAKPPDPDAPQRAGGRGRGGPPPTAEEYQRIEEAALKDRSPGFEVTIPRPYYLGKYEVTQAQWNRVMGKNPSVFQGALVTDSSDDRPVDSVTWEDTQAFLRRLNQLDKSATYRLPTEFEWEFAARAGAEDDIPWNDIRAQGHNSSQMTVKVGSLQPNKWGLYDLLGNVWEWVQDFYNEKMFNDPAPPKSGKEHVLKGGGFTSDVKNMTYMWHGAGPGNKFDVGFRVLREVR